MPLETPKLIKILGEELATMGGMMSENMYQEDSIRSAYMLMYNLGCALVSAADRMETDDA